MDSRQDLLGLDLAWLWLSAPRSFWSVKSLIKQERSENDQRKRGVTERDSSLHRDSVGGGLRSETHCSDCRCSMQHKRHNDHLKGHYIGRECV